jgi:hypothetical protein
MLRIFCILGFTELIDFLKTRTVMQQYHAEFANVLHLYFYVQHKHYTAILVTSFFLDWTVIFSTLC